MNNQELLFVGGALDGERHWVDDNQNGYVSTAGANFDTVRYTRMAVKIDDCIRHVMIPELTEGGEAIDLLLANYKVIEPQQPATQMAKALSDTDPMPFGKYKKQPMHDVPVDYLHWLWNNNLNEGPVKEYIKQNLNALKQENKDLIW
jgi:uncharacterized protein (DUF3820 family)